MNLNAVNLDALYLVKLIFGKYFCHFDSNFVAASLQLQMYLDANPVPVRERVNQSDMMKDNILQTSTCYVALTCFLQKKICQE